MSEQDSRPSEDHIKRTRHLHAVLLPALREAARRHGYALAVHGSLERDIDLIAAPWRDGAGDGAALVSCMFDVCKAVVGYVTWPAGWTEKETFAPPIGSLPNPDRKPHGRLGFSIILGAGPYLDISVMPLVKSTAPSKKGRAK